MENFGLAACLGLLVLVSYVIGVAFMPAEKEDDYLWSDKLKMLSILILCILLSLAFAVSMIFRWI